MILYPILFVAEWLDIYIHTYIYIYIYKHRYFFSFFLLLLINKKKQLILLKGLTKVLVLYNSLTHTSNCTDCFTFTKKQFKPSDDGLATESNSYQCG